MFDVSGKRGVAAGVVALTRKDVAAKLHHSSG
jgi:hypothetical protein